MNENLRNPKHSGKVPGANAVGTSATFVCGSFVRFLFKINPSSSQIEWARYQTNGCGFMVAAAEVIADELGNKKLEDLHGLSDQSLKGLIAQRLESFEPGRSHCRDACFEAVHGAFADYRALRLEEFQGEKALICTCFGVTEERMEAVISSLENPSIKSVGDVCNAGTGCGSCRMLIEEMICSERLSAER